ncbi:trypsin-like peptidase domain-containing protein, partial [Paenibacillus massiliensis]|uniref:trypsin-like peptidase domain-containing protein n=1 Tax=Paenibacillus massiliensis TaxID=225917 RepID=UPI00047202DC
MGLFDDDFYSTKVSSRTTDITPSQGQERQQSRFTRRRRPLPTAYVAIISGLVGAVVAVLLFSFITGVPGSTASRAAKDSSSSLMSGDPYERIVQAAAKIRPSVVSIVNHRSEGDLFAMQESALGSGVIFRLQGGKAYIMTNNHVVEGSNQLEVVTVDGETKKAKVIGKDRITDIAVLSVDDKNIRTVA